MRLKKALCGLRVAAHLVKPPCKAAEETMTLTHVRRKLAGSLEDSVVVLCYVDDLLITGESDEAIYHVVEAEDCKFGVSDSADSFLSSGGTSLGIRILFARSAHM